MLNENMDNVSHINIGLFLSDKIPVCPGKIGERKEFVVFVICLKKISQQKINIQQTA